MTYIPEAVRQTVIERARQQCEYCGYPQAAAIKRHHIDHVFAEKHGGATQTDNLCLACFHCNLHKGSDLASLDPHSGEPVLLFHPRRDIWQHHFTWHDGVIEGVTAAGRTTARLLHFNDPQRVTERQQLQTLRWYHHP